MPEAPLSPEEIAHRSFPTSFRGFDTGEVRAYLARVADELRAAEATERELHRRVAEAEQRAANPVLDQATLSRSVGQEMARLLASAQEAAQELRAKAEENAGRILREAHDHAQRVRDAAEQVLAERSVEAERAAAQITEAAEQERAAVLERAERDGVARLAEVEAKARKLVEDAQADRDRILADLARRRRMVNAQVQQLRAGRGRLLDAYRVVRRTLDEVSAELERVEVEARTAADEAARRPVPSGDRTPDDEPGSAVDEVAAGVPEAVEVPEAVDVPEAADLPEPAGVPEPPVAPLRIVRDREPPPALRRLDVVQPPAEVEAVRVVVAEPVAAPAAAAERAAPAARPAESVVDDLFARMRAEREAAVSRARDVLAPPEEPVTEAPPSPAEGEVAASTDAVATDAGVDTDEALRERRDAAVEGAQTQLARRLKRALQDEQNEALDRLRAGRSRQSVAVLVPPEEQAARLTGVARPMLDEAFAAGARFTDPRAAVGPAPGAVGGELVGALAGPLRRSLEAGLAASGDDDAAMVDRIGAAYRECRAQRVDGAASDAVVAAFAAGSLAAAGGPLRWVVDDDGQPCSDCEDNALAGPTAAGDAYPTGQPRPPAHAGCRCLLAPAP